MSDAPLRLEYLRQVRIAVERDAVGFEREHFVERAVEAVERLLWQPVDQVEIHRAEAARTRFGDNLPGCLLALHAVHRALHVRVEILHADRQAVEAQFLKECHRAFRAGARVDLDRALGARAALEACIERAHQCSHLLARQERRRAAAPVQLADLPAFPQQRAQERQLLLQVLDIL